MSSFDFSAKVNQNVSPSLYCKTYSLLQLETTWPIKIKFYTNTPKGGETKVCANKPKSVHSFSHTTNMAAKIIYGKTPSTIFFIRKQKCQKPFALVCSFGE